MDAMASGSLALLLEKPDVALGESEERSGAGAIDEALGDWVTFTTAAGGFGGCNGVWLHATYLPDRSAAEIGTKFRCVSLRLPLRGGGLPR